MEHEGAQAAGETAALINGILNETGMSEAQLAIALGLPAWTLHRWRAGDEARDRRMLCLAVGALRAGLPEVPGDTADVVRQALADLGMTQPQLAAALGVKSDTVNRWVQGVFAPAGRVMALAIAALRDGTASEARAALETGRATQEQAGRGQRVTAAQVRRAGELLAGGATEREAAAALHISLYSLRRYVDKAGQPRPAGKHCWRGSAHRPRGIGGDAAARPSQRPRTGGGCAERSRPGRLKLRRTGQDSSSDLPEKY